MKSQISQSGFIAIPACLLSFFVYAQDNYSNTAKSSSHQMSSLTSRGTRASTGSSSAQEYARMPIQSSFHKVSFHPQSEQHNPKTGSRGSRFKYETLSGDNVNSMRGNGKARGSR